MIEAKGCSVQLSPLSRTFLETLPNNFYLHVLSRLTEILSRWVDCHCQQHKAQKDEGPEYWVGH